MQQDISSIAWGRQDGAATLGDNLAVLIKLSITLPYDPAIALEFIQLIQELMFTKTLHSHI